MDTGPLTQVYKLKQKIVKWVVRFWKNLLTLSPLGFPGSWNCLRFDLELTGTEGTVCGRAASSVGRAVEPVDETPDPRRATIRPIVNTELIWFSTNFLSNCYNGRCLTLMPIWIRKYIHYKVWDKITYPFPNFNDANVEVWKYKWIRNCIPHFTGHGITFLTRPVVNTTVNKIEI